MLNKYWFNEWMDTKIWLESSYQPLSEVAALGDFKFLTLLNQHFTRAGGPAVWLSTVGISRHIHTSESRLKITLHPNPSQHWSVLGTRDKTVNKTDKNSHSHKVFFLCAHNVPSTWSSLSFSNASPPPSSSRRGSISSQKTFTIVLKWAYTNW